MANKPKIFEELERMSILIPTPFYWADINCVIRGVNEYCFGLAEATNMRKLIGKTAYDLYTPSGAAVVEEHSRLVMKAGKKLVFEEKLSDLRTGESRYYIAIRAPLFEKGEVVGLVGVLTDITMEKETGRLKLEAELQQSKLQEQEKFQIIAEQVAHDIRSPLASLSMIVGACKNLPESERVTLRDVTTSIGDIANNLLSRYGKNKEDNTSKKTSQHILVSLALSEVLSSKRYQYKNLPIKFNCFIDLDSNFAFIKANASDFSRMISNLINNAVESFEGKDGTVHLGINVEGERVKVTIQDNGKGMGQDIMDKIMNSVSVTSGKRYGNGIGLVQVRSVLQANKGKMSIESKIGIGTKITLVFPRAESAEWISEEIELNEGDIVVILDDDSSIHGAWKSRFKPYKADVQLRHFKLGKDAIEFVGGLSSKDKEKVFLLSDFELINQEFNGLQIIEQIFMQKRSVLVTSHYGNQATREMAAKVGVKILPKQLVSDVRIQIKNIEDAGKRSDKKTLKPLKKVDLVIIDDHQVFADSLAGFFRSRSLVVDVYYSPKRFLENLSQYTKDTKICADNNFGSQMSGIELAKKLHAYGYTNLYILSGNDFDVAEVPGYLTMLLKGDMDGLNKLIGS